MAPLLNIGASNLQYSLQTQLEVCKPAIKSEFGNPKVEFGIHTMESLFQKLLRLLPTDC